ncbi:MAG: ribosomal RNA small subunit methyltransferase A [Candidatus Omnitrophica bacterium]|nr:ribosomal RNA small subunit methyltransferase A [Candidatus Omnitrophota bacterium]
MKQNRRLSQIFLKDRSYIKKIISNTEIDDQIVLEIGSGSGALSALIAEKAKKLLCLEIDERFCRLLKQRLSSFSNVEIIKSDVLNYKFKERLTLLGNVPYHISKRLIYHLTAQRTYIDKAYLTFQKEFASKLIADCASPYYCQLSCFIQCYAKISKLIDIPSGSFKPRPKVDSSFIRIDFYNKPAYALKDELLFEQIISKAFSQKRKKIINSLSEYKSEIYSMPKKSLDFNLRAQDIPLKSFVLLANRISSLK